MGYREWNEKWFSIMSIVLPTYHIWRGSNRIKTFFASRAYDKVGKAVNWGRDIRISGWEFRIGNSSSVGTRARLQTPLTLGNDVMMGANVKIFRENHRMNRLDVPIHCQGMTRSVELIIGNDVWICDSVIITPGCRKIGNGSVLAAGAVITKNVGEYEIWGGNPARCLRKRGDM